MQANLFGGQADLFEELNLSADLLKGLYVEMKFERPSKIQTISLPMILTPPYKHLIVQAHNGSGKTTCFMLGMLSRVDPKLTAPLALCICPTRELAIQCLCEFRVPLNLWIGKGIMDYLDREWENLRKMLMKYKLNFLDFRLHLANGLNMEVLKKMRNYTGITSECAIPMDSSNYVPISKQAPVTAQVVIGTPGTINKWATTKKLSTNYLKILVFDEVDHMLAELLAVKKLDTIACRKQSNEDFLELVFSVSKLKHANVVELVGYCAEHGQQLLVFLGGDFGADFLSPILSA
ncbi:DEAD-box ATP-dependent RNA helicase 38-like [Camellia sinensis]|uniref:DEAD-box ATP-dependent RNA helicase 38-like n=1 Tax=Camellia sinensis TaxID=4442 RepID=UPI0010369AF4|nr:DEAD-box ATP-dependent RNA helicase 38-like [Camellia sinensis]